MPQDVHRVSEPDGPAKLEIAHILFTDAVGFSQLSMEEQKKTIQYLGKLVRKTEPYREADENNLIKITTGDGFALVFFDDPEAPIKCARELGQSLRAEPRVKLRMGVHSGAVYRIPNINERTDVTGTGINMAQRVMDCGDAGHIIASGAVANILGGLDAWAEDFHDLGRVEIKGGDQVRIYNVYGHDYGNPETPATLLSRPNRITTKPKWTERLRRATGARKRAVLVGAATLVLAVLAILAFVLLSGPQQRTLAVVPFAYVSDEEKILAVDLQKRLASNLSELTTKISVKTSSRPIYNSSVALDVGRGLGAATLLKGTVKKSGENIYLDVQLIDIESGKELFNQPYSGRVAEVSGVEQDILQRVTERLDISLTETERQSLMSGPSKSASANLLYEEAVGLLANRDADSLEKATEKFKKATDEDPTFARGLAKLADSLVLQYVYGTSSEGLVKQAEEAANRALKIRPRLADAHLSLAYINFRVHRNWVRAEEEFKTAIELDSLNAQAHDWYADYLEAMNRHGEAIKQMHDAVKLAPGVIWVSADLGLAFCYAGQSDQAYTQLMMTLTLETKNKDEFGELPKFAQTHNYLGLYYQRKGDLKNAITAYQKAAQLDPASTRRKAILAQAYAQDGQTEKARQELSKLTGEKKQQSYFLALVYAALRDPADDDMAFAHLNTAIKNNEPGVVFLQIDPRFSASFRRDSRFVGLLSELGFPSPNSQ